MKRLFFLFCLMLNHLDGFILPSQKILIHRKQIDFIDERICDLLEARLQVCEEIGRQKKSISLQEENTEREKQIISRLKKNHPFLSDDLIDNVWKLLFTDSKERQKQQQV